jgi:hypothetical protein
MPVHETADFLAMSWQARGLYRLIVTKLDRNGRLDLGKQGLPGVAHYVGAPWSEIEPFLNEIVRNGVLDNSDSTALIDPRFAETQRRVIADSSETPSIEESREEENRKKKTKKPGRPPADPRHQPMINLFFRLWAELRGGKYEVSGADAKAVYRFLKGHPDATLEEMERRMRIAFADRFFAQNGSVAWFCSKWKNCDRIVAGKPTVTAPAASHDQFAPGVTRETL